jgi:hypothetical protein
LADCAADVSEALRELDREIGLGLSVPNQVSIARELGERSGALTAAAVVEAFQRRGLRSPSRATAGSFVTRVAGIAPRPTLRDVLLDYRRFAIRDLSPQFGAKTKGREDELRYNLLSFLPERGYTEARTGKGRTDILLVKPTRIIEVKVWESRLRYEDGLVELERYIETEHAHEAYLVVFGDRVPLPSIVPDSATAIAEERSLGGLVVPVFVVPFEVDPPSKAAAKDRRRARA